MNKRILSAICVGAAMLCANAQTLTTEHKQLDKVFGIATETLYRNVKDSIINAGGTYGGEWTRDVSINSWNAANMLIPEVARFSLWNVTTDRRTYIGHQYWDQIIWVTGAYDHYLATHDEAFLKQAYIASSNSMKKLEKEAFDRQYGLFTGPSVFNDGIAGYEEPVFDPSVKCSYVLEYPEAKNIKCLSTNCIYYNAYKLLAIMAGKFGTEKEVKDYLQKAETLKQSVRRHLFDADAGRLDYLIDGHGTTHHFQEGLGMAFAIMFGVVNENEARKIVDKAYVGPYGLPSVYPSFKRFSKERPGRHNVLVWPFVNAFWAEAALNVGRTDKFVFELENMCNLVLDSKECFYEIYDTYTGKVCGGWQAGSDEEWGSVFNQTWSATGFLRMVLRGMLGLEFSEKGLCIAPQGYLLEHFGFKHLADLRCQAGKLSVKRIGTGCNVKEIRINGKTAGKASAILPVPHQGNTTIEIVVTE